MGTKKRKFVVFVFFIITLCLFINNLTFASTTNDNSINKDEGFVLSVKGISKLEREGKTYTLKKNMNIQKDDIIVTSLKTTLVIKLDNSKEITIGQLSNVKIVEKKGDTVVIAVKNGTVISEVNKKIPSNDKYEIMTPKLVASIRGTVCQVSNNKFEDTSNVSFLNGYGIVGTADKTSKIVLIQGQKTELVKDNDFTLEKIEESKLNITEMEYLENNINIKDGLENRLKDNKVMLEEEHSLAFKTPNSQNEYPSEEFYTKKSNAEMQIASIILEQIAKSLKMSLEELKSEFGKNNITISELADSPLMAEKLINKNITLKDFVKSINDKKASEIISKEDITVEKQEVKQIKKEKLSENITETFVDNEKVETPEIPETPEIATYSINTTMLENNVVGSVKTPNRVNAFRNVNVFIKNDNKNYVGFEDIYYTNSSGTDISIKDSLRIINDKNIFYRFKMPAENVELKVVPQTMLLNTKLNIALGFGFVDDIFLLPRDDMRTYQNTDIEHIKLIPVYRLNNEKFTCKIPLNSTEGTGLTYNVLISYFDLVKETSINVEYEITEDNILFELPDQYVNGKLIYDEIFVSILQ